MVKYICSLCPHNCRAARTAGGGNGFCASGNNIKLARAALHMWEEPPISGENGSGAVFFSGCTLRCVYCQNYDISTEMAGVEVSPFHLAEIFSELESKGAHNINLVTPTHYVPQIIEAFEMYRPSVPVVYNSSGYEKTETLDLIAPYIDIWMPDFKYSESDLALRLSGVYDYPEVAVSAIKTMQKYTPESVIENGIMTKGMIVRHLVLPAHTSNSIGVLNILTEILKENTLVSLMGQYVPCGRAGDFKDISRKITKREYNKVCNHMMELGLDGFVQEHGCAEITFIPDFDFTGT